MKPENYLPNARHTLAHLLAAAVLKLYPDALPTLGPAIEDGFYYDFEFKKPLSEKDLGVIEKEMRKILPDWQKFEHEVVSEKKAREIFAKNPYKLELIDEIVAKKEKITLYTTLGGSKNEFTDLCRGGHVENPAKEISADSFKLDRIAGAYWRGDEKNKMLSRIYGLAFGSAKELGEFVALREEAKKRDHKKLGKELGLFVFSDLVGPGLPLWTPKGTTVRHLLDGFVWELRKVRGYKKVTIPHITKKALYETSGHWAKFGNELLKITTRENHFFAMKPMNCPHHTQIFAAEPKSYRDMPVRYAETTMVYRDEQSGELSGLSRVLSITQDDAHIFCREDQVEAEIFGVWDIIDEFYGTFGFKDMKIRFSRHDPKTPEKYLGTPEIWKRAEENIRRLIEKRGVKNPIDGLGEAAMYAPKIDFIAKDSLGRALQVATIQLDYNLPKNFGLVYTNEKGGESPVAMIHCAIMGSIERFVSVLIEHYAGAFPLWLSPVQVAVIPIAEAHTPFAKKVLESLSQNEIRAELLDTGDTLGKRIRQTKLEKIPYTLVIGDKEIAAQGAAVESREAGSLGIISIEKIVERFRQEIATRK